MRPPPHPRAACKGSDVFSALLMSLSMANEPAATAAEGTGLWLIGVGALLVAVAFLWQGSAAGLSGRPGGPAGTRTDRVVHAVGLTGALLVAAGSVVVAIDAFPEPAVVLATVVGAAIAVWLFAALRLRIDNKRRLVAARQGAQGNSPLARGWQWDAERFEREMSWRRCLRNPFISDDAAHRQAVAALGERPDPYETPAS